MIRQMITKAVSHAHSLYVRTLRKIILIWKEMEITAAKYGKDWNDVLKGMEELR